MAILAPCSIFCSFEGVVLSVTAIHIVLTTLWNWICRPATPTPEELIRSRRENHACRSAVNRVAEVAPRPAADKHPYHRPCHSWWWYAMALWPARDDRLRRKPRRKWWWYILALWPARDDPSRWFILTTAWSISILTFIFFLREISPDIYQGHVRFFTILSFLALEVGRAAYFYHLLKDCSVLVREVCIGLMGHVTGGFCRLGSLFAVPRRSIEQGAIGWRQGKSTETSNHDGRKQSWMEETSGQLNGRQRCRGGFGLQGQG